MSERTLKRLLVTLGVVVLLWLGLTFAPRGEGGPRGSGSVAAFFTNLDTGAVEAVRMIRAGDSVVLRRDGEGWTANGYRADSTLVQDLLRTLEGAEAGDLAATNPANHARMGVSTDSAVSLTVASDGEERTLLVGDQGPRYGTAYARVPDEDPVYVVEGNLRPEVRRSLEDWRNKRVIAIDTSRVQRIVVEQGGAAYTVERADSAWTLEDGMAVDLPTVRGVLSELSTLRASGFLEAGDSLFALPRAARTVAYDAEGTVLAEVLLGEGEGDRWVRTPGDSVTYRISSYRAGRVAPSHAKVMGQGEHH